MSAPSVHSLRMVSRAFGFGARAGHGRKLGEIELVDVHLARNEILGDALGLVDVLDLVDPVGRQADFVIGHHQQRVPPGARSGLVVVVDDTAHEKLRLGQTARREAAHRQVGQIDPHAGTRSRSWIVEGSEPIVGGIRNGQERGERPWPLHLHVGRTPIDLRAQRRTVQTIAIVATGVAHQRYELQPRIDRVQELEVVAHGRRLFHAVAELVVDVLQIDGGHARVGMIGDVTAAMIRQGLGRGKQIGVGQNDHVPTQLVALAPTTNLGAQQTRSPQRQARGRSQPLTVGHQEVTTIAARQIAIERQVTRADVGHR